MIKNLLKSFSLKIYSPSFRHDINLLRIVSVFAVFFYHLNPNLSAHGTIGVDIFIVITGFINSKSLSVISGYPSFRVRLDSTYLFLKKRILRLKPALIVVGTIASVATLLCSSKPQSSLLTWFLSYFGLSFAYLIHSASDYFSVSSLINTGLHTWSLGVEEVLYVILSLICLFPTKNVQSRVRTLTVLTILAFIPAALHLDLEGKDYFNPFFRLWEILLGTLFYYLSNFITVRHQSVKSLAILFLFILVVLPDPFDVMPDTSVLRPLCVLLAAFILLASDYKVDNIIADNNSPSVFKSSYTFLASIGIVSYSVYLVHWPLITVLRLIYNDSTLVTLLALALTLPFSYLLYYYVESMNARQA